MSETQKNTLLSLQNWLTLMRFLVIEGTNNRLLRTRENLGLRGEEKEETPEELMVWIEVWYLIEHYGGSWSM